MTKQEQYHEYLNFGGTMSLEEWEKDGRYDAEIDGHYVQKAADGYRVMHPTDGMIALTPYRESSEYVARSLDFYTKYKAAAPAMYEALKWINDYASNFKYADPDNGYEATINNIFEDIQKALAIAEGKEEQP